MTYPNDLLDRTPRWIAWLLTALVLVLLPLGCADDSRSPGPLTPGPPSDNTMEMPIGGGQVPDEIVEGEPATISVWGAVPDSTWLLERLEVNVVAMAGDQPGRVEITAIGRPCQPGELPGGDPTVPPGEPNVDQPDSVRAGTAFVGMVTLPPLEPGEYLVVLHGPGGDQEFHLRVIPGNGWIRFRAFGDPNSRELGLMIRRDGTAIATSAETGVAARVMLSPETLRVVSSWFTEAGFAQLEDRYLSDPPLPGRTCEISLREGDVPKTVVADDRLMPEALRTLVGRLERLAAMVLGSAPQPTQVYGRLEVEPISADPGTPRVIRLYLVNEGQSPVTLSFGDGQHYDFVLMGMGSPVSPPPPPVPPPADSAGNPIGGCPGGHYGGMAGGVLLDNDPETTPPDSVPETPALVWNWAFGLVFTQQPTTIELAPGQVQTYEETWNGLSNEGEVVGPGTYALIAPIPCDLPVPVAAVRVHVSGDIPCPPPLAGTILVEPAVAGPGTARSLTLLVTNLGVDSVEIHFPTTQRYDFMIFAPDTMGGPCDPPGTDPGDPMDPTDPNGGPGDETGVSGLIWVWSANRDFQPIAGVEIWLPGETRTFTERWDGLVGGGEAAGPGIYELSAFVPGRPHIGGRSVQFVVTRP